MRLFTSNQFEYTAALSDKINILPLSRAKDVLDVPKMFFDVKKMFFDVPKMFSTCERCFSTCKKHLDQDVF